MSDRLPASRVAAVPDDADLRDLFESATLGLHFLDANGNIIGADRADRELLGYAGAEYVGRHVAELHHARCFTQDVSSRRAAEQARNILVW